MLLNELRPVAAALSLVAAAACGGASAPAPEPMGTQRVDESKAATVAGRVTYAGEPPNNPLVRATADPFCVRETPAGTRVENIVVSEDSGLENVFVYVKDRFGQYQFDIPAEPVVLDQSGCIYRPHVVGVMAGQPLLIMNSDDTLHNVNARAEHNTSFNVGQPMKGMQNTTTFTVRDVMIRFKCDVHPWMSAYVGVVEHPYFTVTAVGGRFELKNLPAGTYTVEAWHERLGTRTETVTLGDNESKEIGFTFTAPAN